MYIRPKWPSSILDHWLWSRTPQRFSWIHPESSIWSFQAVKAMFHKGRIQSFWPTHQAESPGHKSLWPHIDRYFERDHQTNRPSPMNLIHSYISNVEATFNLKEKKRLKVGGSTVYPMFSPPPQRGVSFTLTVLVCFLLLRLTLWPEAAWGGNGLFGLHIPNMVLHEGISGRELKAGTETETTETTEERYLPACSPWLAQLVTFCYNPGPIVCCSGVVLPLHSGLEENDGQTYLEGMLMEALPPLPLPRSPCLVSSWKKK